jgi:uncharacterized repeat protein (TIGR04138 family)
MSTTSKSATPRLKFHHNAYDFVFDALRFTQQQLGREVSGDSSDGGEKHISGGQLLEGIRVLALRQFGQLTTTVLRHWGVKSTDDFGRIVFELIELGKMRKTDQDQLADFCDVYDFEDVFDRGYRIDARNAFRDDPRR